MLAKAEKLKLPDSSNRCLRVRLLTLLKFKNKKWLYLAQTFIPVSSQIVMTENAMLALELPLHPYYYYYVHRSDYKIEPFHRSHTNPLLSMI